MNIISSHIVSAALLPAASCCPSVVVLVVGAADLAILAAVHQQEGGQASAGLRESVAIPFPPVGPRLANTLLRACPEEAEAALALGDGGEVVVVACRIITKTVTSLHELGVVPLALVALLQHKFDRLTMDNDVVGSRRIVRSLRNS